MNGPRVLHFYFDYVDPLSLILSQRLQEEAAAGRIRVEPRPMEINPPPHPLLHPEADPWASRWMQATQEEKGAGVPLARPWIVPWSRKAHELAFCAREENCFREIHESLFRAYLIEGKDIGRVDILLELARGAGMDPMETKAVLDVDRHGKDVEDARAEGIRAGVVEIPSIRSRERILPGVPTPEDLRHFLTHDA